MTTTSNGLQLANLGEYDDDPEADDVYVFAYKMNENLETLDTTVGQASNAANNLKQIEAKGVIRGVIYGGRLGVDPN